MSSKHAAARGGKELTFQILSLLTEGRLLTEEEIFELFPHRRREIMRRIREMKRLNYLSESYSRYTATPRGKKRLNEEEIWNLSIPSPKKWDRKWRVVLFDIPANRKKHRDTLRLRLKELGLVLYQDSVWIYPYPLEKVIAKITEFYYISDYVSFATVEKISGEGKLRRHFNL